MASEFSCQRLTAIWALGSRLSSHDLDQFWPAPCRAARREFRGPGRSSEARPHRRCICARCASGMSASLAGTRPVLKSITETRSSSTRRRSTVPAITRPSASVAASGASPSEPSPNKAEKRLSEMMPQTCSTISLRAAASASPAERSSQRSAAAARSSGSTDGQAARAAGGSRCRAAPPRASPRSAAARFRRRRRWRMARAAAAAALRAARRLAPMRERRSAGRPLLLGLGFARRAAAAEP